MARANALEQRVERAGSAPRRRPSAGRRSWSRPAGPSSGLSTSEATTTSTSPSRSRAGAEVDGAHALEPERSVAPASRRCAWRPRAASRPAPASLVPDPPSPSTTRRTPGVDGGGQQLPHAVRRGPLGVALLGRHEVQTAGLRRLDVRRAALALVAGERGRRPASGSPAGPRTVTTTSSPPSAVCTTSTKPGPAVGHRGEVDLVVGGAAPPALGDRLGGLDRGQRARELVRRHQHPHVRFPHRSGPGAGHRPGAPHSAIQRRQVRLQGHLAAQQVAHLELQHVVALLALDRREGVEGAALVQVDQRDGATGGVAEAAPASRGSARRSPAPRGCRPPCAGR